MLSSSSAVVILLAALCPIRPTAAAPVPDRAPAFLNGVRHRSIPFPRGSPSSLMNSADGSAGPCGFTQAELGANPSTLPGDPSLVLTTNVDLGDQKLEIMKACSAAIASATGKPESYVAVCVNDGASMIFGGSDAPLALGCVYSIGAVVMESNGAITKAVSDLLSAYGVAADRVYVNFFDMPRANVGWNGKTFAG